MLWFILMNANALPVKPCAIKNSTMQKTLGSIGFTGLLVFVIFDFQKPQRDFEK